MQVRDFSRIVAVTLLVLTTWFSSALGQQAVTRVEGVITDEVTGRPVGCKVVVISPSGKKNSLTSSSTDGTYLVVINEAGDCKFSLGGFNVYRQEAIVNVPASTKFQEIKKNFKVKEVVEGTGLISMVGFSKNAFAISPDGIAALQKLKATLSENQEMNILVSIGLDEDQLGPLRAKIDADYKAEMNIWEKAVKKTKKGKEPPPQPVKAPYPSDPNETLQDQRREAIRSVMKDVKNSDLRIAYSNLPPPPVNAAPAVEPVVEKTKGKKSKSKPTKTAVAPTPSKPIMPTLVVTIGKVKRLYD